MHIIGGGDVGGAKTHVLLLVNALGQRIQVKIVSLRPGVFASINVTVKPGTSPDLPLIAGEGPYVMRESDVDANNYSVVVFLDRNSFETPLARLQDGSVKLKDIIASSYGTNYSGVSVSAVPSSLSSTVSIGADKDSDQALIITYYGTRDQWEAVYGLPGNPYPSNVQMTLVLSAAGYADTTIKINLAFNGSMYG